jgi:hypothetical protein
LDTYDVGVANPSSVRFEAGVLARLQVFVRSHPGLTLSSGANLLVDEALRSASHPIIGFVDGPGGRRARLADGPDVDVVISALVRARDAEPERPVDEILTQVGLEADLSLGTIQAAVEYWAEYPDEIDFRIEQARDAEVRAKVHEERAATLLAEAAPETGPAAGPEASY